MFVFRFFIYDLNAESCKTIVLLNGLCNLFSNMYYLNYEMSVRKEITYTVLCQGKKVKINVVLTNIIRQNYSNTTRIILSRIISCTINVSVLCYNVFKH